MAAYTHTRRRRQDNIDTRHMPHEAPQHWHPTPTHAAVGTTTRAQRHPTHAAGGTISYVNSDTRHMPHAAQQDTNSAINRQHRSTQMAVCVWGGGEEEEEGRRGHQDVTCKRTFFSFFASISAMRPPVVGGAADQHKEAHNTNQAPYQPHCTRQHGCLFAKSKPCSPCTTFILPPSSP
jgi:hypothetical protein